MQEFGGIDLTALAPSIPARTFPATVPGRVVHIDADFLAYMVSYEKEGTQISLSDMQHNASTAIETMRKLAAAQSVHLHLTPSLSTKGDRYALAIQKEYQGNRKDKPKPAKLHIVRQWLGSAFPATLHMQCEADDGMSSAQYAAIGKGDGNLSVICSKDKDLNMVPGLHMVWESGEIHEEYAFGEITINEKNKIAGYGHKFFWAQLLMGDSADNIQGLPKFCSPHLSKPKSIGPALTYSLLTGIKSNKEAFEYVRACYQRTGNELGFKHWQTGESVPWQKVLVSEMQLLWMRRDAHNKDCVLQWLKEIMA